MAHYNDNNDLIYSQQCVSNAKKKVIVKNRVAKICKTVLAKRAVVVCSSVLWEFALIAKSKMIYYRIVRVNESVGYADVWCNDCKKAYHISRMKISPDMIVEKALPDDLIY